MIKAIYATFAVLYVWFMVFFVPGPKPFGMTIEGWGLAWGIPFCLMVIGILALVSAAAYFRFIAR